MSTVVCPMVNCPLRSKNKFCQSDTVILEPGPGNMLQCKTGLIAAYEQQFERSQPNDQECKNNES